MPFMMGRWTTREWQRREQAAIADLASKTARTRLHDVLAVDVTGALGEIACPVLYLQASHDRLVPPVNWEVIRSHVPHARMVRLEGPHFILQHQPVRAAKATKHFASTR